MDYQSLRRRLQSPRRTYVDWDEFMRSCPPADADEVDAMIVWEGEAVQGFASYILWTGQLHSAVEGLELYLQLPELAELALALSRSVLEERYGAEQLKTDLLFLRDRQTVFIDIDEIDETFVRYLVALGDLHRVPVPVVLFHSALYWSNEFTLVEETARTFRRITHTAEAITCALLAIAIEPIDFVHIDFLPAEREDDDADAEWEDDDADAEREEDPEQEVRMWNFFGRLQRAFLKWFGLVMCAYPVRGILNIEIER